jgi:hypothetical protein
MSEVLRYGVRDARKKNRILPTLSFPEMLPNFVVDAITALARGEQEAEEKLEMRVEALPDWLEIYQKGGAQVFRLLRRILPDRMIPSMYQLDHFKETIALEYGPPSHGVGPIPAFRSRQRNSSPFTSSQISCVMLQGTTRACSTTSGSC